jgi:hypothetical protein
LLCGRTKGRTPAGFKKTKMRILIDFQSLLVDSQVDQVAGGRRLVWTFRFHSACAIISPAGFSYEPRAGHTLCALSAHSERTALCRWAKGRVCCEVGVNRWQVGSFFSSAASGIQSSTQPLSVCWPAWLAWQRLADGAVQPLLLVRVVLQPCCWHR